MIRRRSVVLGGLCLLTGSEAWTSAAGLGADHSNSPRARRWADPEGISAVEVTDHRMSLTFDDGPDPRFTPQVLDILQSAGVTATFFVIGRNARAHPEIITEMLARGHSVQNHTLDHRWLDELESEGVTNEIVGGNIALVGAGAPRPAFVRPPRGWTNGTVSRAVINQGMRSVFWSDCLEAYQSRGPVEAAKTLALRANPGSIILCHDGGRVSGPNPQDIDRSRTVATLPRLIDGLLAKGLTPVTLSDLLA